MKKKAKKIVDQNTTVNLSELIKFIDKTPAILWSGQLGVRERLIEKYGSSVDEN